jgi:NitT/TauT family transport system permease protein
MKARYLPPLLTGLMLLLVWLGLALLWERGLRARGLEGEQAEAIRRVSLPTPLEIGRAMVEERATLGSATLVTLETAALGFLAAAFGGYAIALLLSSREWVHRSLYPWILIIQMTPIVILAPIIVLWIKHEASALVAVTFLIGFFPVVASATAGLRQVDRGLLDLFRTYDAGRRQELLRLRIPGSIPATLTGLRIAATLSPIGAITADLFIGGAGGRHGLGYLVYVFKSQVRTPELFATALAACLLGFVFVGGVGLAQDTLLRRWASSPARN